MTYEEGLTHFKSGDYVMASEAFASVTELDENNHKAWNALGICLSKTGEYESAGTCFDNAVTLAPENITYKKNQAGNAERIQKGPLFEVQSLKPLRKFVLT